MKKIVILMLSLFAAVFMSCSVIAQDKPKTQILSVKQKGETVRFNLVSSKPFIYGNNRYLLYIGSKEFGVQEQSKRSGKGYLTYLIPADEFKRLSDGAPIYLHYGQIDVDDENMEELAKQSRRCWSLGKFSKSLLK